MAPSRNTERIINACHSMTDCDIQRSWDLLAWRAEWHLAHKASIAHHFVEATRFYAVRCEGLFRW